MLHRQFCVRGGAINETSGDVEKCVHLGQAVFCAGKQIKFNLNLLQGTR